jgi:hypothetical protein
MTTYQRRPSPVLAFQYKQQPRDEWPAWVRDYKAYTSMGEQPIVENLGTLIVPTRGSGITAHNGNWIVLEGAEVVGEIAKGGVAGVYTDGDFRDGFDPVAEPDAA